MKIATKNHICTNFEQRLLKFIRLRLGYSTHDVNTMVGRLKKTNTMHTALEQEWLQWLELPPTARNISSHLVLFLGKLYDMLTVFEPMLEEEVIPEGCTVFTLLPQTTSCVPSLYKVNTSILYQIAKRILCKYDEDIFGICKTDDRQGRKTFATTAEFQSVRERMWRAHFDLKLCVSSDANPDPRLGRGCRMFEYEIRTNGYAICVLTSIPAPLQRPPQQPGSYKPRTLIGIDPGLRMPFTAYSRPIPGTYCNLPDEPCTMKGWCSVCHGHNGGRRYDKRRRGRRDRRNSRRRSKAICNKEGWCEICQKHQPKLRTRKHGVRRRGHFLHDGSHVQQVSSREYRYLARIEHHAHWFENTKERYPGYGEFIDKMPSYKTSSSTRLLERFVHMWTNINDMLEFCASRGFRKWRFTISRFKRKAVCQLAKRIVPHRDPDVCVCLGKRNNQKWLSGHMYSPLKRLASELAHRATAVHVDEFRTSCLCSDCFTPMVGKPFAVPDLVKVEPSRNVRLCRNLLCAATCWERDVNAAKNMWQLGLLQVTRRPRAWQFVRGRRL